MKATPRAVEATPVSSGMAFEIRRRFRGGTGGGGGVLNAASSGAPSATHSMPETRHLLR